MHQVGPAAIGAAGVFGFLVARALVYGIGTTIYWVTSGVPSSGSNSYPEAVALTWQGGLAGILDTALPLAVGIFLGLWRLPIRGDLRMAQVVGRGAVATALGAVLVGAVQVAIRLSNQSTPPGVGTGGLYNLTPLDIQPIYLVLSALSNTVVYLPLVVLAAVLLWIWLRRDRPTASVNGAVDEV